MVGHAVVLLVGRDGYKGCSMLNTWIPSMMLSHPRRLLHLRRCLADNVQWIDPNRNLVAVQEKQGET